MRRRSGATKGGCLGYLLVVAAILYVGVPAGEAYLRYLQYKDAMKQEVRFRGNQPNEKIKSHLALMADSLGLPAEAADVTVRRDGNQVVVEAAYDELLKFPGFQKTLHFEPHAADTY